MRSSTSGLEEKVAAPGPPPGKIRMSKFACAVWEGSARREGKSGMMRMLRVRLLACWVNSRKRWGRRGKGDEDEGVRGWDCVWDEV